MNKECTGLFGRLFGHKYKPAMDEERIPPGTYEGHVNLYSCTATHNLCLMLEAGSKHIRTYRGHVCTRCGDVVNKQEGEKE
jgi:hypothetical protein